ncbi:MAG: flippase-like domain-containing protein [Bacteroidia bacterium]|nr:flippase-like domain-containing protein [Bacteroidia bacterium]
MKKTILSKLKYLIYPAIAFGLLYWVYTKIDVEETIDAIKNANYFWVIIASLVSLLSHLARALRWKMLIEPMGYESSNTTSFYSVILAYAVNYVTPRMGEVARCAIKSKSDNIPVDKLVGTVVTERVFDLLITILVTMIAFVSQYDLIGEFFSQQLNQNGGGSNKVVILAGLAVAGILGYLFYKRLKKQKQKHPVIQKIINFISGLEDGAKSIFKLKRPGLFIAYTLAIWILYFTAPYLLFFSLEGTSHLGLDASLTTLIVATMAIIIPAPGGIGSFHYFVPLGLALYGININLGTSYAFITHTSHLIMIIVVTLIILAVMAFEKKRNLNEAPSQHIDG